MNKIDKVLLLAGFLSVGTAAKVCAQEKIVNPPISYAGVPGNYRLAGLQVSGVEGYEDYVLTNISGLQVGQEIEIPGNAVTDAVKRYWKHGLFSDVSIAADSIIGNDVYLHIYLKTRPRVSTINYSGVKKSEQTDLENSLGLLKGGQITPNMIDRAKLIAKKYFDDKGYKNAEINIRQREDVVNKNHVILDIEIDKHEKLKVRTIISMATSSCQPARSRVAFSARELLPRSMRQESWATSSKRRSLRPSAGQRTRRIL